MRAAPFLLVLTLLLTAPLAAQRPYTDNTLTRDPAVAAPAAALEDIAWLAGHWRGEGLGGDCEEIWSGPAGGSLMGVFRMIDGEAVAFYEIMTVQPEGESLAMVIKHFNPDLTGWEEREDVVTFPLLRITPTEAHFDGLTLRHPSPERMDVYVVIEGRDGSIREEAFHYTRVASH